MPGFYSDFFLTNNNGRHVVDGTVTMTGYQVLVDATHPDGRLISIRRISDSVIVASNVLLHHNGPPGPVDLNVNRLVFTTAQLAALPEDLQTLIKPSERTPYGYRTDAAPVN